jgi:hypothetical protein
MIGIGVFKTFNSEDMAAPIEFKLFDSYVASTGEATKEFVSDSLLSYTLLSIQVNITSVVGGADGTIGLQVSNDNVNWDYPTNDLGQQTIFTLPLGSSVRNFVIGSFSWKYVKLVWVRNSVTSATINGFVVAK